MFKVLSNKESIERPKPLNLRKYVDISDISTLNVCEETVLKCGENH